MVAAKVYANAGVLRCLWSRFSPTFTREHQLLFEVGKYPESRLDEDYGTIAGPHARTPYSFFVSTLRRLGGRHGPTSFSLPVVTLGSMRIERSNRRRQETPRTVSLRVMHLCVYRCGVGL